MKKYYFFLLLIPAVSYLNAQQTDRPLFRDFMNKRNDFASGSENNTTFRIPLPKAETKRFRFHPQHDLSHLKRNFAIPTHEMARLSHVLPNGNKVYILPQDNMPCVVPDTRGYNMPVRLGNVNTDEGIYATPPQRIIPLSDNPLLPQQQTTGKK